MDESRFPCPCCGFFTLPECPPGTFAVCPVCWWEDDQAQFDDPTRAGGANRISLVEARENFLRLGAMSKDVVEAVRPPLPEETN